MNLKTLRSTTSKVLAAFAAVASAAILGSCGGGGAGSSNTGSQLEVIPSAGTFYAGVPYNFTVAGGVVPYLVTSSQPDIFPVPLELTGHTFTVIPNNPGVIDAGLAAGALLGRTVVITARDKNGAIVRTPATNGIFIAQNFLTGYGVSFFSTCAAPAAGGVQAAACAGGESILTLSAVTNGGLFSNRMIRLDVIKGPFGWLECDPSAPVSSNAPLTATITCPTDHEGKIHVRLRVQVGAETQLASYRVTDVASGVTTVQILSIVSAPPADALTVIPSDITLTGPALSAQCGRGPAGALIFNGQPPYTAFSTNPVFSAGFIGNQVSISGSGACESGEIIIQDARGRRTTISVTAEASATAPPALTVSPATANLNNTCGYSVSTAFIGGGGQVTAISNHPRVTASVSSNTITITRALSDAAAVPPPPYPNTATVSVTDGTVIITVAVTGVNINCP